MGSYLQEAAHSYADALCGVQAEAKAADVAARLEELLSRTTQAWLPLWLEEHYNKASAHPTIHGATSVMLGPCNINPMILRTQNRSLLLVAAVPPRNSISNRSSSLC